MIGTLIALVLVLFMGAAINGTRGWFIFGPVQIQPAEFVVGAGSLRRQPPRRPPRPASLGPGHGSPYLGMTGSPCCWSRAQPDMGSAMVAVFAVFVTLFAAGARPRDLSLLAGGGAGSPSSSPWPPLPAGPPAHLPQSGRRRDRQRIPDHPGQIAIGSGGFDGVGIGNGSRRPSTCGKPTPT